MRPALPSERREIWVFSDPVADPACAMSASASMGAAVPWGKERGCCMAGSTTHAARTHYLIMRSIVDHGYAPTLDELAAALGVDAADARTALRDLADEHGVVLHPNGTDIWVAHPFALAPTNFLLRDEDDLEWWGNCAWCSLGAAALLDRDLTITTTVGANDRQVDVRIQDGVLRDTQYYVHFPIPMRRAWDNVVYTCSTMHLFDGPEQVDAWCRRHRIPRGDVQPIATIWEFSKVWYGRHLDEDWAKWSGDEARAIFQRFGLSGDTWQLEASTGRF